MKRTCSLACLLSFAAVAGFAQTPQPNLDAVRAAIFSPAPATPEAPEATFAAAKGRIQTKDFCSASASCAPYATIGCSTTATGATCEGHDRNCSAGQGGYVRCGTTYTYCSAPACACTEGSVRYLGTGSCCEDNTREKAEQQCTGGVWIATGNYTCGIQCGPFLPQDPQPPS